MSSLLVVIASVLSSGVIAALISASFTDVKERWVFRRQKIEELYLNAAKWLRDVENHYILYLRVCKGDISYNDALDLTIGNKENSRNTGDDHLRIRMNITMYEPTLLSLLCRLEDEQKKLNKTFTGLTAYYKKHGESLCFFDEYNSRLTSFGKAGDALKSAIVSRGASVASEPTQVVAIAISTRNLLLFAYHTIRKMTRGWRGHV